jgi:anthranilate phosphoribosyltransferase
VLHSVDGYDEVSLTGPLKVFFNRGEKMVSPADLGLPQVRSEDILGGQSVEEAAAIFKAVLEGKGTVAQSNAVIANAAMALYAADQKQTLAEAVERAREALVSGKALSTFRKLIESQN